MKTVRLMFVGAGRVSQHYTKILKKGQVDNFKIVSVVDTKHSAATSFSNYWEHCKAFTDINEAIRLTNPDLCNYLYTPEIIIRLQNIVFCPIFMY